MVRETMAFRATEEPRLIREMATPKPNETHTALRGMFQPGWTYVIFLAGAGRPQVGGNPTLRRNGEKGNPLSLAKDQIWREAVATSLTTAETRVMMMMATIMLAPT